MHGNQREVDLAYVAGLIDGEGTFCISRSIYRKSNRNPCFTPYVRVGMTTKMPLEIIHDVTGMGNITYDNRDKRSGFGYRQKGFWLWSVSTVKRIPEFLELIILYIRLKKPQAILMKKFCEGFQYQKYKRGGVPKDIWLLREQIYFEMSLLNGFQRPQRLNPEASYR